MNRNRIPVTAVSCLFLLGVLLAGCATGAGTTPGGGGAGATPAASADPVELRAAAAWLDGGRSLGLVTWGSSSCVPHVSEVRHDERGLEIELAKRPGDDICTEDYGARGLAVPLPESVDPAQPLDVRISGEPGAASFVLAAASGLDPVEPGSGAPSAGWTDEPGTLALLTWGSSSCPPLVQDAAPKASGEIEVVFAEEPADRVCTKDFAPRVSVLSIDGVDPSAPAQLVLSGGGAEPVRLPVAGQA